MRFDTYQPTERLRPYIKYFVVSEQAQAKEYKVLPAPGMVIGFQYKGQLSTIRDGQEQPLDTAGITGMTDRYQLFKNSQDTGTVLVYFTETGFAAFAAHPANELFNLNLSLQEVFDKASVGAIEEKLALAVNDQQRIKTVEQFLLSQLKALQNDQLIAAAVKLIYDSKGTIRIKALSEKLFISQSPLEKRFRRIVGTSPKKFASLVRFNTIIGSISQTRSLTDICYEHHFFDQAHFIKDFKRFTGDTPEQFRQL